MPAAVLTGQQRAVIFAVKDSAPHATALAVAKIISRSPAVAQHMLDALTRRGFVTPELYEGREVYFVTGKGERY